MKSLKFSTRGYGDILEITSEVQTVVDEAKVKEGVVHLFVVGSTASITTCEDDHNLFDDIRDVLEEIAPYKRDWKHHRTWHDDNGASHVRATIFGPSLCVPIHQGKIVHGTWQKIILIDFDTSSRNREVVVRISEAK